MQKIKKYIIPILIITCAFVPFRAEAMTVPVDGMFSYGGLVLYTIPCTTSLVIIVGPPSPAIINYQLPITLPRPEYIPFVPGVEDLGNAFIAGFCYEGIGGFYVPTAYILGDSLIL
ncbi:MAG: hypothetical protein JWP09_573 [Candidatus Taylorbacteria bacterium]|nr:hypothetical protein [Candidatus Taylorbacteria bacterium]